MNTRKLCTESRGIRQVATVLDSEVAMTPSTSFMRSLHSWSPLLRPPSSDFIIAAVVCLCLVCRHWSAEVRINERCYDRAERLKSTLFEGFYARQVRETGGHFGLFDKKTLFSLAFLRVMPLIDAASDRFRSGTEMRSGLLPHKTFLIREARTIMAKKTGSKPMTKTEIMRAISETTGLPKKDVVAVVESLTEEIGKALRKSGMGVFSIPGLVKIERRAVPARPAQKNVKNPFTGELQDRPAKPASVKVRVRALKNLKAMVEV